MQQVFLLTGRPGAGKTTLIIHALAAAKVRAGGFYTGEIRKEGCRTGFRISTLDGREAVLAETGIKSPYSVSRYGVDIGALGCTGVPAIREAIKSADVIVIDEIGKMELFSQGFREAVTEAINSGKKVLGTIMLARHPFSDEIKRLPQARLVTLTADNRRQTLEDVIAWLKEA